MSIGNMKVAHKLWLGFACVVAAMFMASAVVYFTVQISTRAALQADNLADVLDGLDLASAAHLDQAHTARGYILTKGVVRHKNLYNEAVKLFEETSAQTRAKATDHPDILVALDKVVAASRTWRERIGDKMIAFAGSPATLQDAVDVAQSQESSTRQQDFRSAMAEARKIILARDAEANETDAFGRSLLNAFLIIGSLAGCLLAALIGWILAKSIADPIILITSLMTRLAQGDDDIEVPKFRRKDEIGAMMRAVQVFKDAAIEKERLEREQGEARAMTQAERDQRDHERTQTARESELVIAELGAALQHLASGDLTYRIETPFPSPAMETLRQHFNNSAHQLEDALMTVAEKANAIGQASKEISTTTEDLSRRSEQQAANLEESVKALAEITKAVKSSAEGAGMAHTTVAGAAQDASTAVDIVTRTTEAMKQIDESSRKITQIVSVIDDIAFQTNLLALNAGVEAARAGEAGNGFAVVASEVRALAQRASSATKEIERLIAASTLQVSEGVKLVGETGGSLVAIARQVEEINTIVARIASSAQDQSASLQEINSATRRVDGISQQNVAMIEETTAAIKALSDDTVTLTRLIGRFQLGMALQAMRTPAAEPQRRYA